MLNAFKCLYPEDEIEIVSCGCIDCIVHLKLPAKINNCFDQEKVSHHSFTSYGKVVSAAQN